MPIIGFNFTKLAAEKKEGIISEKIESDLRLIDILPEKIDISNSSEVVRFVFEFEIVYGSAGNALLSGNVLYMDEPKEIKNMLTQWSSNRKIKTELMAQVLNAILFRCNVKALSLEQDVALPPHFKLPRINQKTSDGLEKKPSNPLSN